MYIYTYTRTRIDTQRKYQALLRRWREIGKKGEKYTHTHTHFATVKKETRNRNTYTHTHINVIPHKYTWGIAWGNVLCYVLSCQTVLSV